MALHLVTGGSGTGKSHWLYTYVIEEAKKNPEINYLVLVPEQHTMATQKKLVKLSPSHAIMNVDIVSFQRLAIRVFDELGLETLTVLDDTGKNLIIRKVMENHRNELTTFASNLDKVGFVEELKSIISELLQYAITPNDLQNILHIEGLKSALVNKLKDVWVVYDAFMEYIKKDYITSEETLSVLAKCASRSKLLANSVLVLDGYTGFTPVQYNLMEELFVKVRDVFVTITIDSDEKINVLDGPENLFAMSKETVYKLMTMCDRLHIEVSKNIMMRESVRYNNSDDLRFLEKNVFRYPCKKYNGNVENIKVYDAANPKAEICYVANEILMLTRKKGIRYKDIAVVSTDMDTYKELADNIFLQNQIPVFVDYKRSIMGNPLVELIRSGISVLENSYSYESIFRFLRSGLLPIANEDIDILENYCLEFGIKSKKKWFGEWTYGAGKKGHDKEFMEGINELRQNVINLLLPLSQGYEDIDNGCINVGQMLKALYEFIINVDAEEKLQEIAHHMEFDNNASLALEYRQIYGKVMGLLDKIYGLLGGENIKRKEFSKILDAGFEEIKLGLVPPTADCVLVGDIERTRLDDIKILFFVGVNDGLVPKRAENKGILSELDRIALKDVNVVLAPDVKQKTLTQRFYLYLNITKPSNKLYLSYSDNSMDGKSLRPSHILHDFAKMYPNLVIENEDELSSMWLSIPKALKRFVLPDRDLQLDNDTALMLYGNIIQESVTRLEGFAACEFSHFLKYGLELQERKQYQIEAKDTGSLVHKAMQQISDKLKELKVSFSDLSDEQRDRIVSEVIDSNAASYGEEIFKESKRSEYMIEQMKRLTKRTVWAIGKQLNEEQFTPEAFELHFSIPMEISDRRCKVRLEGSIDRVDICEDEENVYVKIVDYKTGSSKFDLNKNYEGIKLQLMTYMRAALELEKKRHPGKNVVPAGAFFFNVDDPLVDIESVNDDVDKKILKELSYDGLINFEIPDETFGENKEQIKKSNRITEKQFLGLSNHMTRKMSEMSDSMTCGSMNINPYWEGQFNSCTYCGYRSICGFYNDIPGNTYRRLKKLKDEEIWEAIAKEEQANGENVD